MMMGWLHKKLEKERREDEEHFKNFTICEKMVSEEGPSSESINLVAIAKNVVSLRVGMVCGLMLV